MWYKLFLLSFLLLGCRTPEPQTPVRTTPPCSSPVLQKHGCRDSIHVQSVHSSQVPHVCDSDAKVRVHVVQDGYVTMCVCLDHLIKEPDEDATVAKK